MDAIVTFHRRSAAIELTLIADSLVLSQDDHGEPETIYITPDQVPQLCQWLTEAAHALTAGR